MIALLLMILLATCSPFVAHADVATATTPKITAVTAQQRYPWNGLVDIVVTFEGLADDAAIHECTFVATNCATGMSVPVTSVTRNGLDAGSGTTWMRRFVWNATNDIDAVKIDDLVLTVDVKLAGVQLWENGPYWAECNVGASRPEEYGYYFWWGDTVGYKRNEANNGWISVKDGSGYLFQGVNCPTYGKYRDELRYERVGKYAYEDAYIDDNKCLRACYDAATASLGAPCRMPTAGELSELAGNCISTWAVRNGVYGRLVTGKGNYALKSIFLPAGGSGDYSFLFYRGTSGWYWSSQPYDWGDTGSFAIRFGSNNGLSVEHDVGRANGFAVRPLRGFSSFVAAAHDSVSVHLKLDFRSGVRACSAEGETIRFDASWIANGDEARITDNGVVLTNGTEGVYTWKPELCSSTQQVFRLEILSSGQVVSVETAEFACAKPTLKHAEVIVQPAVAPTSITPGVTAEIHCSRCGEIIQEATEIPAFGYIRNVVARQVQPWGLVEIKYELPDDLSAPEGEALKTSVVCEDRQHATNYTARTFLKLPTYEKGIHVLLWDALSDGITLKSSDVVFRVAVERFFKALYCVIDVSGGTSAAYYPVSYLDDVPVDGWSDEYKTTKIVLRYIEPGVVCYFYSNGVVLTKPFFLGVFEVTQKQYELVTGERPSYFFGDMRPVEEVSWNTIKDDFIPKLQQKTGLMFDLPTEAQWHYACQAGTTTTYSYGDDVDDSYMWYSGNSGSQTHEVGTRKPNDWGLYDMHGNVWEWCLDWYGNFVEPIPWTILWHRSKILKDRNRVLIGYYVGVVAATMLPSLPRVAVIPTTRRVRVSVSASVSRELFKQNEQARNAGGNH